MGGALWIVWGVALGGIAALGAFLAWTLWRQRRTGEANASGATGVETLLFYYEQESVRGTPRGEVIVRVPGVAWEREWQDDLLRLEVSVEDPVAVQAPAEWGAARVLAAYSLRAYRMTDLGTDIDVERFAAPVDVFLTIEGLEPRLRFGVNNEGRWILAPPAALSPDTFEDVDIPAEKSWAAASIAGMREICLVRMPEPGQGAEEQDDAVGE